MSAALRETFNEVAELYDRARPDYPEAVFDGITELTGLCAGSRVLEIGGGTGQATASIAECGCAVTAVELGASMAEIVRRNLARFPKVTVINSSFEEWVLPEEPFDLVVAATAFHWIDPTMRLPKVAAALGQGGCFALIDTVHINEELE
ncbi:MAG: class I SAM-dependent methyltransferase, partial [Candidatus Dormibacteraceae bacterium]